MPFRKVSHMILPPVGVVSGVSRVIIDDDERVRTECVDQYGNESYSVEETSLKRLLKSDFYG